MIMNTYRCKVLLTLSLLCVSMVSLAQDIIVKKDGTTIKARVEKVTDTVIEYKRFSNLTGPTYTIKILDLLAINYENGETETFSNTETVISPSNEFFNGGERRLSDAQLLALSRRPVLPPDILLTKGKRMRVAGLSIGGALIISGIATACCGVDTDFNDAPFLAVGTSLLLAGAITSIPLIWVGQHKINTAKRVQSTTLLQYEMPLGKNSNLSADVNLISDNVAHRYTPGVGFHINF